MVKQNGFDNCSCVGHGIELGIVPITSIPWKVAWVYEMDFFPAFKLFHLRMCKCMCGTDSQSSACTVGGCFTHNHLFISDTPPVRVMLFVLKS